MKKPYHRHPPMLRCPHCEGPASIRRSTQVTRLVRDGTAICCDDDCACCFSFQVVAVRTIHPSLRPHPDVSLPARLRPDNDTMPAPANDVTPTPANDDRPASGAETMTPT